VTADSILERVQAIVSAVAGPERTPDDAGPDTPLGDAGYWLDSVDELEVILACEHEFGTVFEEHGLPEEALLSARGLADLIRSRLGT